MKQKLLTYPQLASKVGEYSADASSLVQIVQSYIDALQIIWAVLTGLAILGLLSSFMIQGLDLHRAFENDEGEDGRDEGR